MEDKNKHKYHMTIFHIVMMVVLVMAMSTPATAYDWPMWRNDASNTGNSTETINLPLTEQWHSSAPSVEENGAVVSNGIVYMSTDNYELYAFNVSTGDLISGFPVTIGYSYGTPTVDSANQKVYALTMDSKLYAFNLDGTSAWTATVGYVGENLNEGPIIDEGFVYIKAGNLLQKYNSSGSLQWSSSTTGMNTQPSIMGDHVYVNSESGQIRKYSKATGTEVTTGGFPIISTASVQAALTTVNGKIFLKDDKLYAYNASNGSLLWSKLAGGSTYYGSQAVSSGVVYVYGWDGKMYAFDENTGATMTGFPSVDLNPGGSRNWGSPTIAGDKIFIGAGTTQKLKVLGAAGTVNAGQVLANYSTYSTDPQGFDLCSPVISDGVVFAMLDGGGLYAFFGAGTEWTGGAITINGGADCTESQEVTLALDNGSNDLVNEMRISEDPLFSGAAWEPYSDTRLWTLSSGFGIKTVYVQYKDSTGQLSNVFNDQIEYSESCNGDILPGIDIEKSTNGEDADNAPGPYIPVGAAVTWNYTVTNIGNVNLTGVTVTDNQGEVVTCPKTTLNISESMTCTASNTSKPGQYANIGNVTGEYGETTVSAEDSSHYYGESVCVLGTGTPGYWKNHPEVWDGQGDDDIINSIGGNILIGDWNEDGICNDGGSCIPLTQQEAIDYLTPHKGDKTYTLARALTAAWLNVLVGNPSDCCVDEINQAVILLIVNPPGSNLKGKSAKTFWKDASSLATTLDQYNNGMLCAPHRDSSDLMLVKTASETNPLAGESIQYIITISNSGPANATDVTVTDTLDDNLTFNASLTSGYPWTYSNAGKLVTCTLSGEIPVGDTVTLNIGVDVNSSVAPGIVIWNWAEVASQEPEYYGRESNNNDSVSITIGT